MKEKTRAGRRTPPRYRQKVLPIAGEHDFHDDVCEDVGIVPEAKTREQLTGEATECSHRVKKNDPQSGSPYSFSALLNFMAEREGFEPSTGVASTRFPVVLLRPLGHLSVENSTAYNITKRHASGKSFSPVISQAHKNLAERQGFEPWDG